MNRHTRYRPARSQRKHTGRVDTHTNSEQPCSNSASESEGAEESGFLANYDEIGHRTGPRKKRTLYIADAKQATGHLITEIQIGQRMLGIIENTEQRQICTGNGGGGTPSSAFV